MFGGPSETATIRVTVLFYHQNQIPDPRDVHIRSVTCLSRDVPDPRGQVFRPTVEGSNKGSNSSSTSEGVYDRYTRRRSKGGRVGDNPGYVTILEREEETDMLRVLESGAWDEETFSKLLMSS